MKVECVHCGASGQMDETRIPVGVTSIRCPRCKESFPIPAIVGNPDSAAPEGAVEEKGGSPSPPVEPPPLHEAAAQASPPSASPPQQTLPNPQTAAAVMADCTVCAGRFPRNEMVRFGTSWVCAKCKPLYVLGLTSGKPVAQGGSEKLLEAPRYCSVGDSMGWISKGFGTFKESAGIWIGLTILFVLLLIGVSLFTVPLQAIPIIGGILGPLVTTPFIALINGGILLGCRTLDRGEKLTVSHLFSAFNNTGRNQLVYASLINLAINFVIWICISIAIALVVGVNLFTADQRGLGKIAQIFSQPGVLTSIIFIMFIGALLLITVNLLFMYVPMLTLYHQKTFGQAISLSCKGAIANIIPLIAFSLVVGILFLLGAIPLLLGLLVVYPMMLASHYHSYKQVFLN